MKLFNKFTGLFFGLVLVGLFACKTTEKATATATATATETAKPAVYSPAGTWKYTVTDTPMGDVSGTFTLTPSGSGYAGTITSDEGTGELRNVSVQDSQLSCSMTAQGYDASLKGMFEGESFKGAISVEGYDFDVTAERMNE